MCMYINISRQDSTQQPDLICLAYSGPETQLYETNDYRQNSYQVPAENSEKIYDRRISFSSIATNLI